MEKEKFVISSKKFFDDRFEDYLTIKRLLLEKAETCESVSELVQISAELRELLKEDVNLYTAYSWGHSDGNRAYLTLQ